MKPYLTNFFFTALISICFVVFHSCSSPKKQEIIYVPPLPVTTSDLINSELCKEQNQKLAEIKKLFLKKKFKLALNIGIAIVKSPCSLEHYKKALEWIGDIFNARGEKTNAFYFYEEALNYEINNSKTQAQAQILRNKIVAVISHMSPPNIIPFLNQIQNREIHGQVLFQSGLTKIELGNEAEAVTLLNEFVTHFSQHKEWSRAESILKSIKEKKEFKKNKIGVLLPLSGQFQLAGLRVLDAIQLAVKEFNLQQNTAFHLSIKDTASDPEIAVEAVKILKKEKAACIIGPMITVRSAAIESNNLGVPMILLSQKPDVTKTGQFILRNYMTPVMQIRAGVSYFMENYGFTRFAILYPNEKYGIAFKDAFMEVISQYDVQLAEMVSYEPSQTDFADQINQFITGYQKIGKNGDYIDLEDDEIKERNRIYMAKIDFDVLFIPDTASMVNMIAPQLKFHGIDVSLMGTNLWNSEKLLSAKDYVQKAIFPDGFYPGSESEKVKNFVSSYFQINGNFPEYSEIVAYDTAMIVMSTLSSPSVVSRKDMVNYLQSNTFDKTITCPTSFDMQGEPVKSLELFQVTGNEIKLIRSCNN